MGQTLRAKLYSRTGFPDLLNLKQAAAECLLSEERLLDLAKAGYAPCGILDNEEYVFFKKDLMDWVKENLFHTQDGRKLGTDLKIITDPKAEFSQIPETLLPLSDRLKELRGVDKFSCIYFLVKNREVVYVGQSVALFTRIEFHLGEKDFDKVFYFHYPREELSKIETAFIRYLKPKYNKAQVTMDTDAIHDMELKKLNISMSDIIGAAL